MKNTKKLISIYLIALFAFLSIACSTRTIALFTLFNSDTMHFKKGLLFPISAISVVAAAFLFLSFFVLAPRKYKLAPNCSALQTFIPSGMISVAFLFMAFSMFYGYNGQATLNSPIAAFVHYIPLILTALAVLSCLFFFITLMFTKRVSSTKAAFGLCTVIFVALYGIYLYFSKDIHPTNSPNKTIDEMAYFATALFLIYETRIFLGRDLWTPYISFGMISALLTGYSAIPALIIYFSNGTVISDSITENVLTATLFIYITVKMLLTLKFSVNSYAEICRLKYDFIIPHLMQ